ncbi:MAG: S-methyl-5-thioribose-1-phosphate isomerase [Spirochaetota bacterium]
MNDIKTLEFSSGSLHLLDQRKLPHTREIFACHSYEDVEFAIRDMVVRGAPAIGATAAYGVYLAAVEFQDFPKEAFFSKLREAGHVLNKARPTAVNLSWAVKRMLELAESSEALNTSQISERLLMEAKTIQQEDVETNRRMGAHGNSIIPPKATILTHCNTGALATAGWGTALGVIRSAVEAGKDVFVFADETRPRLQGGRLTAWELVHAGIPVKLIADNTAAFLMQQGKIDIILVGADRIAANGDTSNKIGTYMLSVLAKEHGVPFYVVAPVSTIDYQIESGAEIPIEERAAEEVTHIGGTRIAPEGIEVYNPAFDVTPHSNISGVITEYGVARPPFSHSLAAFHA